MNIEHFQALIKENNGNLSDKAISVEGIKTREQVEQLIHLLSNKDVQIGLLSIEVGEEVADFFVAQFKDMTVAPKIEELRLPCIKLTHGSWEILFGELQGFKSLKKIDLENSNFDYSNDLRSLGNYLASNPILNTINLCHDKKIDDKTFHQLGSKATELLTYLNGNKNLREFKYGHKWDIALHSNLSPEIQKKLEANGLYENHQQQV